MQWWIWLIIAAVAVGVVVAGVLFVQARRRAGGVISTGGETTPGGES